MSIRLTTVALLVSQMTGVAMAAPEYWYPEDGTWRNPQEPGRNFKIDMQDRTLILNVFGYRQDGSAAWYQAAKPLIDSGDYQQFQAVLNEFKNGQCIGCPYTFPEVVGPSGGNISILFTSPYAAQVNWEGEKFDIVRSNVVVGSAPNALLGTWIFSYQISTTDANTYTLTSTGPATDEHGTGVAIGTSDEGKNVKAECYESGPREGKCVLAEYTSGNVSKLFEFDLGINQVRGDYVSAAETRYPMWGYRIVSEQDTLEP